MTGLTAVGNCPLTLVVGSGGVGKTTLAAALALRSSIEGFRSLVMTFDPSRRLKSALGLDDSAAPGATRVASRGPGALDAALLDARATFDRLICEYSQDDVARDRILKNRYYSSLAGHLSGVFEYMAVERLYEVHAGRSYERVVLDTPPTRNALDFLDAPRRVVDFLDSGLVRFATRGWFDDEGHLRPARSLGPLGRKLEGVLERNIGLGFLRDVNEFFSAFRPLYAGFRERAAQVEDLLRAPTTSFVLVTGPGPDPIPDTLFFARRLIESGYRLEAILVNRLHPLPETAARPATGGAALMRWLATRDRTGLERMKDLVGGRVPVLPVPMLGEEPAGIGGLERLLATLAPKTP
jgi:anion-transporting  ArsA/GET3 family ATPase